LIMSDIKTHWENIYETKKINEVSWFQEVPKISLDLIASIEMDRKDKIIDIGSGKSYLIDNLLKKSYTNISILDISKNALDEVKQRTKSEINYGNFYCSNILKLNTDTKFKLWHDRAVFHFLTKKNEINNYIKICENHIDINGFLIIGTFSEKGPLKCSGLEISRYSVNDIEKLFSNKFSLIHKLNTDHLTPFNTIQNFNFCVFKKVI
ncbi:MAG: class I SAM-dependent methyltransferase, partial [Flavobacteriaceae bacterium]|nr:class I SAM-dependent methyltransferase [Flavobacteriaceae bacterium]